MYTGGTIWNYLSNKINTNCTITTFKHHLKKCLILCRILRVYVSCVQCVHWADVGLLELELTWHWFDTWYLLSNCHHRDRRPVVNWNYDVAPCHPSLDAICCTFHCYSSFQMFIIHIVNNERAHNTFSIPPSFAIESCYFECVFHDVTNKYMLNWIKWTAKRYYVRF